ncbi:hypothetical protein B0H11DRAFT_1934714 [Mycena galericulata]|nr:hypothetical protein B0H11DRAFT_1934714 [Mycena galericulata]
MVFKAILNGFPMVAKRFRDIGAGEGNVNVKENHDQLIKEVARLARTGYFLQHFIGEAKKQGVDSNSGGLGAIKGLSVEEYQATFQAEDGSSADPGLVVWLFEPRRSSPVKHWSGTNDYPAWPQNKLGSTLNAFTHYAYLFSHESTVTVLADLQSIFWAPPMHHIMFKRRWGSIRISFGNHRNPVPNCQSVKFNKR